MLPVALRPVIAGVRRRDHLGLRRVFRDGAGSDGADVTPALPSRRWVLPLSRRVVASDSALRAVRLSDPCSPASPPGSGVVRLDFLSWGFQRSSSAPLGFRISAVETVTGLSRGSRIAFLVTMTRSRRAPVSGSPVGYESSRTWGVAPPSTSALRSRLARVEVATSSPGLESLAAPPKGLSQPSCPGAANANLLRRRPVLVVSHDLDGVTTLCLSYLATSLARRVAASPRPPSEPTPRTLSRLSPVLRWRFRQTPPRPAPRQ